MARENRVDKRDFHRQMNQLEHQKPQEKEQITNSLEN